VTEKEKVSMPFNTVESFKLHACQRLSREEDFKRLIKKGKRIRNRFFFILYK